MKTPVCCAIHATCVALSGLMVGLVGMGALKALVGVYHLPVALRVGVGVVVVDPVVVLGAVVVDGVVVVVVDVVVDVVVEGVVAVPVMVGRPVLVGGLCPGAVALPVPALASVQRMSKAKTANAQWRRRIPALSAELQRPLPVFLEVRSYGAMIPSFKGQRSHLSAF